MFKKIGIRFKEQVTLTIALLCLTLIAASAGSALWIVSAYEVDRLQLRSSRMATRMASLLDLVMFERFREVNLLSSLEPMSHLWQAEAPEIRATLNRLQASLPTYAWIGYATPDGVVRAATQGILEGQSVKERSWFVEGLKGPAASDVHEALLLSSLLPPSRTGEPPRFVDVSMPVYAGKAIVGVLGAHLKWSWIEDLRQRFLASEQSAGDMWILSSDGKILLGPDLGSRPFDVKRFAEMKIAGRGAFVDRSASAAILTGYATTEGLRSYKGLGWIVVARRPASVAYAPVQQAVRTILLYSSIVAAVGLVLAWIVARRSVAPLLDLTSAVRRIGQDLTGATLPQLGSAPELVELSSSLRSLLRRVGVAETKLTHAEKRRIDDTRRYSQTIDKLRDEADHDPLTGLLNRRAFIVFAQDALSYFRRYGRSIAILMVDIDHFKSVNDSYGHAAGDAVLCQVAEVLQISTRTSDKVSRFGGEEFVVLLREIALDDIVGFAERLRASVAELHVSHEGTRINVTVSIGAALVSDEEKDIRILINRADKALYAAKSGGRNRVQMVPQPTTATAS